MYLGSVMYSTCSRDGPLGKKSEGRAIWMQGQDAVVFKGQGFGEDDDV
jgi:hypothetical protein